MAKGLNGTAPMPVDADPPPASEPAAATNGTAAAARPSTSGVKRGRGDQHHQHQHQHHQGCSHGATTNGGGGTAAASGYTQHDAIDLANDDEPETSNPLYPPYPGRMPWRIASQTYFADESNHALGVFYRRSCIEKNIMFSDFRCKRSDMEDEAKFRVRRRNVIREIREHADEFYPNELMVGVASRRAKASVGASGAPSGSSKSMRDAIDLDVEALDKLGEEEREFEGIATHDVKHERGAGGEGSSGRGVGGASRGPMGGSADLPPGVVVKQEPGVGVGSSLGKGSGALGDPAAEDGEGGGGMGDEDEDIFDEEDVFHDEAMDDEDDYKDPYDDNEEGGAYY